VRRRILASIIGLAIAAILLLYWITFTVRWQEKALVLTFGKISRTVDEAGLEWRWPWQNIVKFDGRIRTLQQQLTETQTSDKQAIIVSTYLNWRIVDAREFYESFRTGAARDEQDVVLEAENRIRTWLSDAANIFAEVSLSNLVTLHQAQFRLAALESGDEHIKEGLLQRVRAKAQADDFGIQILDVGIWRLGVPDDVTKSVFDRMREERQAVVTTLLAEGSSRAESIRGEARSDAIIIQAQAEAQAKALMGQGDAEAAAYYQEFLKHPELAKFLRRLETLRNTLKAQTTIILDSQSAPYELLTQQPEVHSLAEPDALTDVSQTNAPAELAVVNP
jgi:membrane protease subunit HflC